MRIVVHPKYTVLSERIKEIPSFFSTRGETIYKGRNEVKVFETDFGKIVVKSFCVPHLINRLAYTYLRFSKAERSYAYSLEIMERGFQTPQPIAYIELFKGGLISESFYVSGYTDFFLMRNFTWTKRITEEEIEILKAFARFTAQLHEKEIYHTDYSPGNILYKKENDAILFELIDVNRVQFKKVSEKMAFQAFQRMDFSVEMLEITAREYASQRHLDVEKSVAEIKRLNLKTMRKFRS